MLLLGVKHRQQEKADCLVACTAMVLEYLGIKVDYRWLRRQLGTTDEGTPFPNVQRLEALHIFVEHGKSNDLAIFEHYLEVGLPVIVGVQTFIWSHWAEIVTEHAVVVVGIDQANDRIYIHDPFFLEAPIEMSLLRFQIGWTEGEGRYAVIGLTASG